LVGSLTSTAHAGRTFYGWLYGTEVLPERGVELQTWVSEENYDYSHLTSWWIAPIVGITDQLELALPIESVWIRNQTMEDFTLANFGIEARYRLVSSDPVDAPALVPLVRVGVKRVVEDRDHVQPEADVVVSYQSGRVHALVDVGMVAVLGPGTHSVWLRPGNGTSIQVIDDLRFGAEVFGSWSLDTSTSWWAIGPNMAWTHGRFWLSASFGIGFHGINTAPRAVWGILF
jgi:hypothetical protein